MAKYETMMVTTANLDEEASNALINKFKNLIAANGTIDSVDDWGKKRLAYPINDETEGVYTVISFTSEPDFPAELDRVFSRSYQDKNGNNRTAIEIVANNVNFAAPKSANAAPMGDAGYGAPMAAPAARPAVQANPAPSYSAGSNDDFALIEDEGDLPF